MKFFRTVFFVAVCMQTLNALAEADSQVKHKHGIEEVIVVSAPFKESSDETALPVGVLSGEQLRKQVTSTLGDTLGNQLGVHNSSYGPGVGLAVIRGQTGTRVQVVKDGVSLTDVSKLSPDHGNAIEPGLGERIEIIRGPATLLYGNGAIGGVVNVIDERIPETQLEQPQVFLEQSSESASDEQKSLLKINASIGKLNLHLDGFKRKNKNVDVHGYAIDEAAVHALEETHEEDQEEEGEHEEEEIINSNGFIANSNADADGFTLGLSFSGDSGFVGISGSEYNHNYGLPPGSHSHAHDHGHEEEGEGEDDEEDHDEEGQETVRIDMTSTRYDIKAGLNLDNRWVQSLSADIGFTDYNHDEVEVEASGERLQGTRYANKGVDSRFTLSHLPVSGWMGVLGMQLKDTEFDARGGEAFIPKTEQSGLAMFAVERLETERMIWELGARLESTDLSPASCSKSESTFSASASLIAQINPQSNFMVALSNSERAPTIEERYSNINLETCMPRMEEEHEEGEEEEEEEHHEDAPVLHVATGIFEFGNPSLGKETSTNLELAYRKHSGNWRAEVSAYYNKTGDYIFLNLTEADHGNYTARNAIFYGIEGKVDWDLPLEADGITQLSMQMDSVRGRFASGSGASRTVPRLPPMRVGLNLAHYAERWTADLGVIRVFKQDKITSLETVSKSYTRLELYADYHWTLANDADLILFLRGTNLLDEEIRNHTSWTKNYAPEAGRGIRIGLRFNY